ncbi:carbohydrate ABC transporter permease [Occultella gossypii]|uniref:Carbohydrate ABC transporter permease n=1 Tax=Occultella gossypii TaxID=2800820 RepID=A0ABS7SDN8_9MICO|nr:carbohydrate ABC transporter permease [Occultella gossypii]MBZ2197875.1 carbohydrate ABC transporter permease [Occultella gossypii]
MTTTVTPSPGRTRANAAGPAEQRGGRTRGSKPIGNHVIPTFVRVMLWLWVAFNLFMAIWVGISSLKTGREIFNSPFGLPSTPVWENFVSAWSVSGFGGAAVNSFTIVAVSGVATVALAAPAAYVISRSSRRLARGLNTYVALCLALPVQAILVPLFVARTEVHRFAVEFLFGWWDDRLTLVFVYIAVSLPFSVFLLTAAFASLPVSLTEAAELDGASPARAFWSVVVPVAWPGIKSALVLNLLNMWSETLLVLVLLDDPALQTLPAALLRLYGTMQYNANWGGLFAGIVILVYPMIVLYLWAGSRIMEGMTAGAVK